MEPQRISGRSVDGHLEEVIGAIHWGFVPLGQHCITTVTRPVLLLHFSSEILTRVGSSSHPGLRMYM